MRNRQFLVLFTILLLSLFAIPAIAQEDSVHWGYEGDEGADHWGDLSPDFSTCVDGSAQSPISINPDDAIEVDLQDLQFNYHESPLLIFNNGHTIEVEYHEGSTLTYNETVYNLIQFHFHRPSEHAISDEQSDMELHLVHLSEDGRLAVVGVMLDAGDEHDEDFDNVFAHLPADVSEVDEDTELTINAIHLLPENKSYYTYEGSLTTPPCSQGVRWLVMENHITISLDQTIDFASIFHNNARPVQPVGNRDIIHSVSDS